MRKILIALISTLLLSCIQRENFKINITYDEILKQTSPYYLVLIYLDTCIACRDIKNIINYLQKKKIFDIYYLDFNKVPRDSKIVIDNEIISIYRVPFLLEIKNYIATNYYLGFYEVRDFLFSL